MTPKGPEQASKCVEVGVTDKCMHCHKRAQTPLCRFILHTCTLCMWDVGEQQNSRIGGFDAPGKTHLYPLNNDFLTRNPLKQEVF